MNHTTLLWMPCMMLRLSRMRDLDSWFTKAPWMTFQTVRQDKSYWQAIFALIHTIHRIKCITQGETLHVITTHRLDHLLFRWLQFSHSWQLFFLARYILAFMNASKPNIGRICSVVLSASNNFFLFVVSSWTRLQITAVYQVYHNSGRASCNTYSQQFAK